MTESPAEYIAIEPGFKKPAVGSIVAVVAVDWSQEANEVSGLTAFTIVRGTIYGRVIICNDEQITLAFQVFATGNLRNVLSIPWVCVEQVTILLGVDDQ